MTGSRRLRPHVKIPSRIRRHHVLLAAIFVGLVIHEANAVLRYFGESKQEVARETERRMLDQFELWSYRVCPNDVTDFHGQTIDPWGNPYRIVCTQERERVTLAIVSLGPDDLEPHGDLTTVQSFSP